jgi:hypothetical protein
MCHNYLDCDSSKLGFLSGKNNGAVRPIIAEQEQTFAHNLPSGNGRQRQKQGEGKTKENGGIGGEIAVRHSRSKEESAAWSSGAGL